MERERLPQQAAVLGHRLLNGLRQALEGVPQVAAIRGLGLMVGIELNRSCNEIPLRALEEERVVLNVVCNNTIRLLPALICDEGQIDEIVARVTRLLH